jgi:hypothetical protein
MEPSSCQTLVDLQARLAQLAQALPVQQDLSVKLDQQVQVLLVQQVQPETQVRLAQQAHKASLVQLEQLETLVQLVQLVQALLVQLVRLAQELGRRTYQHGLQQPQTQQLETVHFKADTYKLAQPCSARYA